jgi:APA family basic amino acid/polyamine antiporter
LCAGEIPLKLARDGALPAWFAKTRGAGTPVRAQLVGCVAATLLVASNYTRSLANLFEFITLISVISTLVLYVGCSAGALVMFARGRLKGPLVAICATVALMFSLWAFWGAGLQPSLWGAALVATGIPVWLVVRRSRRLASGQRSSRATAVSRAAPGGSSA